jgi:polyhydroxyalkanoate synthesis regulator phasin
MAQQLQKKFIGNNQVDGSKILLEQGQSIKIKDSTGTEVELVKLGASDEVLVNGQEVALKSELTQEISDRQAADLQVLGDAQAYTDGEYTALESALSAVIAQEVSDRSAGDVSTLSSANAYTDQEVLAEETARIAADSSLQSQIDALSGGGSGSLSALQTELDATQVGAGLEPDGSYLPNPSMEFIGAAPSLKDATEILDGELKVVADVLDQEIQDRIAADANLQSQIDNVLSNVDGSALDSLTEIVTAFQAADASLNGAITSLSTGLSADIDAEEAARIAADQALQGEIDAEEVARAAADVTLQNNINAEASARQSADDALDARVDVLESVVWFKEKFSISNGQTSVTLSHTPENKSMSAWVDRLAIHEGASEDFTVSGTSMTFLNDLVSPEQSQIGNGDTVYVKYQYKV